MRRLADVLGQGQGVMPGSVVLMRLYTHLHIPLVDGEMRNTDTPLSRSPEIPARTTSSIDGEQAVSPTSPRPGYAELSITVPRYVIPSTSTSIVAPV
jgi:hypothetical protein